MQDQGVQIESEHLMGALEDALNEERRMNVLLRGLVRQQQVQLSKQAELIEAQARNTAESEDSAPAPN